MTYKNRDHLHNKDVRPRLNKEYHDRLCEAAENIDVQPGVLARFLIESGLDAWVERGKLPLMAPKRQRA